MRVCLETSSLRSRFAGIAYYAWFLADHLDRMAPSDIDLIGFDGLNFHPIDRDYLRAARGRNNTSALQRGGGASGHRLYSALRNYRIVRNGYRKLKQLRFSMESKSIDVVHAINYMAPTNRRRGVIPLVHDISHERYPETHPRERVEWLRARLASLGEYPIINTVSQFSADEIVDFYDIDRAKIRITYPGLNPVFGAAAADLEVDAAVLREHGLRANGYFVAVGTLEPRKNLGTILTAFRSLARHERRAFPLVLIGQPGWGRISLGETAGMVTEGSLKILGYQSDERLAVLYRNARTVLFPAIYEGFGIPTVEALISGKRPLLSDIAVMREVAADQADYVDPRDPDAWAVEIRRVMGDSDYDRQGSGEARVARARHFDWDRTAAATLDMYRDARALFG